MADPAVQALGGRVRIIRSEELEHAHPPPQSIFRLRLTCGRKFRRRILAVRGSADNRMSGEEVEAKAHDLIAPIMGGERAVDISELIMSIERPGGVARLMGLLKS
jgi:2-methylcitrate dehydratase PrpD